jgi:dephospho-CoA kinase
VRPHLVIGLTGGIGSGKTAVADLFSDLGVPVIDADELAHKVVMSGEPAFEAIVQQFGTGILTKTGELDRRLMRERVFANPDDRSRLEAIIHPRVYAEIERQLDALEAVYAIVVVPLLIETGGADLVDRVLVVDAPKELQIERVSRRDGTTPAAVEQILAAQLDRQARLAAADDIIENDTSRSSLAENVSALHQQYLAESSRVASQRQEMKE